MSPSAIENGHVAQAPNSSVVLAEVDFNTDKPAASMSEPVVPVNGTKEDGPQKAEEAEEVTKVGMECDLKNLYQKEDDRGRHTWTDKYPDDLDEAAENEMTARYAILVRNKKSFDSRKKLEIDSIVIQSPLLKTVLTKVLKDYPGEWNSCMI